MSILEKVFEYMAVNSYWIIIAITVWGFFLMMKVGERIEKRYYDSLIRLAEAKAETYKENARFWNAFERSIERRRRLAEIERK